MRLMGLLDKGEHDRDGQTGSDTHNVSHTICSTYNCFIHMRTHMGKHTHTYLCYTLIYMQLLTMAQYVTCTGGGLCGELPIL